MKTDYEMSEADLQALLDSMRPVPMIALQCGTPPSVQENANAAWARLGAKMGFDPPTNPRTLKGAALVLADEVLRLRRGEFICKKCGLRKDSDQETKHEF